MLSLEVVGKQRTDSLRKVKPPVQGGIPNVFGQDHFLE
jgi:hypothetical protein